MDIHPLHIFLAAFIVSSDLTSSDVQPNNKMSIKFRNLFDSISENNTKNIRIYIDSLKKDVTEQEEVFYSMRPQWRSARQNNGHKRRNVYESGNILDETAASDTRGKRSYDKCLAPSQFKKYLNRGDTESFMDTMIDCAFPDKPQYASQTFSDKWHVDGSFFRTLRYRMELDCAQSLEMHCTETGNLSGDLDIVVFAEQDLVPHYVMETVVDGHPRLAVFQLFKYALTCHIDFERVFKNKPKTSIINLLGLAVQRNTQQIDSWIMVAWILVPYRHEKIWINEAVASDQRMLLSFRERLQERPYFESNKEVFVL